MTTTDIKSRDQTSLATMGYYILLYECLLNRANTFNLLRGTEKQSFYILHRLAVHLDTLDSNQTLRMLQVVYRPTV